MKPKIATALSGSALVLIMLAAAYADEAFNYIAPVALKKKIETGEPMTILDIQVKEEFDAHRIRGAVPTYAYPVKSGGDKAKLDEVLAEIRPGKEPVIIVCPRGGGGAERTYRHLLFRGIPEDRLLILRGGQGGWQYEELLE